MEEYCRSDTVSKEYTLDVASPTISSAACLLHSFMDNNDILEDHLVSSLTRSTIPSLNESLAVRRSVIAALAQDEGEI